MEEKVTVLAVDDEINNIKLLQKELAGDYNVLTAEDGAQGWEVLQEHKRKIKAVLIDRMMPTMNGMEFLKKLKADASVKQIPVIMQTAAAEKHQLREGIEAGVYYYLTKPYDPDLMLAVVHAAITDYGHYSHMRKDLNRFQQKIHLIRDCNFEVRTIEDARYLATFLANFFPNPDQVIFGISELVINAIEHGNLGISYREKTELNNLGTWQQEVQKRLLQPEHRDKKVVVTFIKNAEDIMLRIADEGDGFDWQEYLEISPERATDSHGRGIALSKMVSFDSLEYVGCGNEVVCRVSL